MWYYPSVAARPDPVHRMIVGVPTETFPHEHRVAVVPSAVTELTEAGLDVVVESGAGERAGFLDEAFREKGGRIETDRDALFAAADVVLQVRTAGAAGASGRADLARMHER